MILNILSTILRSEWIMKKTKMTVGLSSIQNLVVVLAERNGPAEDQSEATISLPMP